MNRLILALLATVVAVEVNACSCVGGITVAKAFEHADAVFAGVVVSIHEPRDRDRSPEWGRKVTFRVMQWWKIEAFTESVDVWTGHGGGDCGYPVEEGKSYLVYARRDTHNRFVFGICDRSAALVCAAEEELEELGEPIKTYETFDRQSLVRREQPYTTYWRPCIQGPVLIGDRCLEMDKHCRFTVNGVIGRDGRVRDFKILGRSFPERCPASLERMIAERVAQWRFHPARLDGEPIEALLTTVSTREPTNEAEHAKFLKERAEWEARQKQ